MLTNANPSHDTVLLSSPFVVVVEGGGGGGKKTQLTAYVNCSRYDGLEDA